MQRFVLLYVFIIICNNYASYPLKNYTKICSTNLIILLIVYIKIAIQIFVLFFHIIIFSKISLFMQC